MNQSGHASTPLGDKSAVETGFRGFVRMSYLIFVLMASAVVVIGGFSVSPLAMLPIAALFGWTQTGGL